MNNYLNQIETPQVIIGKADVPGGGSKKEVSTVFKEIFILFNS